MSFITQQYDRLCKLKSDINEHLPTLMHLATRCESVAEMGVRDVVSTWAFLEGFRNSTKTKKHLYSVDIVDVPYKDVIAYVAKKENINFKFVHDNSATVTLPKVDLLFIDTWHVYGHLKRELEHHHKNVKKYIVMHDTEVFKTQSESVVYDRNIEEESNESGYTPGEISKGIGYAIVEFLEAHPEWFVKGHYPDNNGLTVLERKTKQKQPSA